MNCESVVRLLVAFQDEELGRATTALVEEHLSTCLACNRRERGLRAASPRPFLPPSVEWETALERDLLGAVLAAGERPEPRIRARSAAGFLGLGLLLGSLLGWAFDHAETASAATLAGAQQEVLPSEQYRPAAWRPESGMY